MQLGQRLGEGIDPRMFVQDYSGFTRAAEIQAQGMQNLGTAIGNVAGQVGDYFKQQGEKKKLVKQSGLQIDAALQLFPDLAPSLQGVKERMRDENIPLSDRAAEAEVVANLINTGIGEMRDRSNRSFEQEKFAADQAYRQAGLGMQAAELGIRRQASQQEAQAEAAKRSLKKIVVSTPLGEAELDVSVDSQGNPYDIQSGKRIGDLKNYATGEGTWETPEQNMPPTSQVGGSINESALPSPLRKYASSFVEQGAKYGVDPALLAAISMHETANGKSSAFRNKNNAMGVSNASGPIQMGSVEASIEKMANLLGKGINQGKGPYANAKSIEDIAKRYAPIGAGNDPRGLNKYWTNGVSSNYEKLSSAGQSDNSTSMIGDLSRQAMGTPEQQAEVARMIEQGSEMGTAEAVPSGAMPTEPSMAAQQPQLPQQVQPAEQPRLARGRLLTGGAASSKFRPANAEEVSMYGTQGQVNVETGEFKPIRPPSGMVIEQTPGGGFRVVQGAGATDRFAQASKEAEKQKLQAADRNIQDLMEAKRLYSSVTQSKGVIPAAARKLEAATPGTELHTIQEGLLKDFKNRLGLEQLTQLRMASPTGAAVGNPTNAEGLRLESVFGSLDPTSSPAIFNRNINRAIESYLDVIHGTPEQRDKLMEEGKITAKQNAQIEALYPSSTMDAMGIEQPRQTDGTGNPLIDEIKKRNNL
jgi:hypothetical protein